MKQLGKFRSLLLRPVMRRLASSVSKIEAGLLDVFLENLLRTIRLALFLDPRFRKNIEDFDARYVFESEDGRVAASAIFRNGRMRVKTVAIPDPTVKVTFRDDLCLWQFLMADDPDVFAFVLGNKLRYEGNLNYLLKFGYMAKHLKHSFHL